MVILITGASHTGKTLLAQRMLEQYKYPYLSIDHLKMGLIRSGQTDLTPEDDDALTGYLWPIVREMVKTAVENHQNLIVEGCYIPFDWRKDFDERYLLSIRFICLAMTDAYIDVHFAEIRNHASDIESRLFDQALTVEGLKTDNKKYVEGFRASGEQVALIESDYEQAVQNLLELLPDIEIRPSGEADLENIRRLWADGEVMKYVGFPDGLQQSMDEMEDWLAWIGSDRPTTDHFSIYSGSDYCGESFFSIDPKTGLAALDIKLFPAARGKGIASKALRYAIDRAFANGASKCYVDPDPENERALALYRRIGMTQKEMPEELADPDYPGHLYFEIER